MEALNDVVRSARALPQLVRSESLWAFRYAPSSDAPAAYLAAEAGVALLEVVRSDGWDRFGLCAASPCCCVYVDRSRNRSRRYCCEFCADRASQAAYRRRRRAAKHD